MVSKKDSLDGQPEGIIQETLVVGYVDVETDEILSVVFNPEGAIPMVDDTVQIVNSDSLNLSDMPAKVREKDLGEEYLVVDRNFVHANTGEALNETIDEGSTLVYIDVRPAHHRPDAQ